MKKEKRRRLGKERSIGETGSGRLSGGGWQRDGWIRISGGTEEGKVKRRRR